MITTAEPARTVASTRPERSDAARRNRRFAMLLAAIALVGLVLRVGYAVALQDTEIAPDGFAYVTGAQDLVEGRGFISPLTDAEAARHPPAWRIVLAAPIALGIDGQLSLQVFACLIGTATIVLVGLLGRRLAGRGVGIVAAAIAAAYPGLWVYERQLHAETAVLAGITGLLLVALAFRDRPGLGRAVGFGLLLGAVALTRSEVVMLSVLLVAPIILTAQATWRQRIGWLAAAGVSTVLVIAPWTIYNLTRFEEPVPLSTGLGGAMAQGYCDPTFFGPRLGTYDFGCLIRNVPEGAAQGLDGSEYSLEAREAALSYASEHSGRLPVVIAARQGRTWSVFRPAQQIRIDNGDHTPIWAGWAAVGSFWVLAPAAVVGGVVLRRRGVAFWPLLTVVAMVAITTAVVFGETRYRASAEIPVVVLAAVGVVALGRRLTRRRRRQPEGPSEGSPEPADGQTWTVTQ